MSTDSIVITGFARTPMGSFQGALSEVAAPTLGGIAIEEAVKRSGVSPSDIDETIMGIVLPAGLGQAPARQASIHAGIPLDKGATTINKMCGSGLKAVMMAHDQIKAGTSDIMVAGGMESMTNAPYLLPKARGGMRMGHAEVKDHMFLDGLEDAYDKGKLMGCFADVTADKYSFTREAQDDFAIESVKRAQNAIENGWFKEEIVPVSIETRKGTVLVDTDESPLKANIEKIPSLRPAFGKEGTVTAANASSISDGAAAVVMMKESTAKAKNLAPIAKIVAHSTNAHEPNWFTTAPVGAVQKIFDKTGWSVNDVDVFEINEAFAVVTMATMKDLNIPHSKVNIHGGACALGHPIGASGARILVTLISALKRVNGKKGIATLCIGGGEAVALAVELV
ncbi:MAG: acetyl-CoA C-acyltransferase [Magnetococcales bacterium]|nr:acetyl-CoA C-acyltransferase [Magnetococcales bacterium]